MKAAIPFSRAGVPSVALLLGLLAGPAAALPIIFSADTSSLSGTMGNLAFDFFDSTPGSPGSISGFSTDGVLGAPSSLGGPVAGLLPGLVTIGDTAFFNELLQPITFGSSLSFLVEVTSNVTPGVFFPDNFSLAKSTGIR